jgi:hypothetical protein
MEVAPYFFAFLAFFGFVIALAFFAFALARVFAFFTLALVAVFGFRAVFDFADFGFAAFTFFGFGPSAGTSVSAGTTKVAGRSASGACFETITPTDSEGSAPRRTHSEKRAASIWNVAGLVSGS